MIFTGVDWQRLWAMRRQMYASFEQGDISAPPRIPLVPMDPTQMVRLGRRVKWARIVCGAALGAYLAYAAHWSRPEWLMGAFAGGLVSHSLGWMTNRLVYRMLIGRRTQGDR